MCNTRWGDDFLELNKIYCMNNLLLLERMESNSIDLIYIDILFNTGKKFSDFVDNLKSREKAIEWYLPRLIEMKRVLKDNGSIYIHCDDRLSHSIKLLLDDIFGEKNFRNEIIWCYRQGGRGKRNFAKKHDSIFFYSKTDQYTFNSDEIRVKYEGTGGFQRSGKGVNNKNGKNYKPNPKGKIPEDWWDIPALTPMSKERVGYDTQKPKALLERIVKASSNKGDIVADFFLGSGTTIVVANELNRNYIGCDINPKSIEITEKRLGGITA